MGEVGGSRNFSGGLKRFDDDVKIAVSGDRSDEFAVGSSRVGDDVLELDQSFHFPPTKWIFGLGLLEQISRIISLLRLTVESDGANVGLDGTGPECFL